MHHWLVKSEPEAYAWADFLREKKTAWTGVRNFAARNNLRAMRKGDLVLFYASVTTKAVMGIAEVSCEAFADPTAGGEGDWSAVELRLVEGLRSPVALARLREDPVLAGMVLFRQNRLSVVPLTAPEYNRIAELGAG